MVENDYQRFASSIHTNAFTRYQQCEKRRSTALSGSVISLALLLLFNESLRSQTSCATAFVPHLALQTTTSTRGVLNNESTVYRRHERRQQYCQSTKRRRQRFDSALSSSFHVFTDLTKSSTTSSQQRSTEPTQPSPFVSNALKVWPTFVTDNKGNNKDFIQSLFSRGATPTVSVQTSSPPSSLDFFSNILPTFDDTPSQSPLVNKPIAKVSSLFDDFKETLQQNIGVISGALFSTLVIAFLALRSNRSDTDSEYSIDLNEATASIAAENDFSGTDGMVDSATSDLIDFTSFTDAVNSAATVATNDNIFSSAIQLLQTLSENVIDAALPLTPTDVVAVALGEGIAGVVGALASFALSSMLIMQQQQQQSNENVNNINIQDTQTIENSNSIIGVDKSQQSDALQESNSSFFGNIISNVSSKMDSTFSMLPTPAFATATTSASTGTSNIASSTTTTTNMSTNAAARQALADGDFLLARAGVSPLLGMTLGLPPSLASAASIIVATVPYQLVKLGQRRHDLLMEENMELERLLQERKQKEVQRKWQQQYPWLPWSIQPVESTSPSRLDPKTLKPVREDKDVLAVEVFTDLTKWLEYDVLSNEFSGRLAAMTGQAILANSAIEGAIFGIVAAVSSQVYADTLYAYFGWGGPSRQNAVKTRTIREWTSILISRGLYAATLFGVYEWAQEPAMTSISAFLSGGVDSCVGSDDFQLCVDTFVKQNPQAVGSSFGAEFRSTIVSLVSFWNRFIGTF